MHLMTVDKLLKYKMIYQSIIFFHRWTNGKPWAVLHANLRGKSPPFKGGNPVFDSGAMKQKNLF